MRRQSQSWAIIALGFWGMLTEEPYWRAVGHGPTLFTWATWIAIVLNAPAWLLARPAAWAVTTQVELRFILEHLLWAALAALQWRLMLGVAARVRPAWPLMVGAATLSVIAGSVALASWRARWPLVHRESIHWDVLDWPIGLWGLALLPALWLVVQRWHRLTPAARPG